MKITKQQISSFAIYTSLIAAVFLLSTLTAQAADVVPNLKVTGGVSATSTSKVAGNVAETIFNVLYFLAGLAAVGYIVWAGIKYITAGGDPKKAEEARKAIINAVIGIVVVAASYFIISLALGLGTDISNQTTGIGATPMFTGLTN